MIKKTFLIILIIFLSGASGIVADRYVFPYLATTQFFSRYAFLKRASQDVTVINKTQQVYVKEDSSISKITDPVTATIVNIISYPDTSQSKNLPIDPFSFKNGTGEIATSDGIIMTYASSINSKNSKYKVITSDSNVYDGQLIGVDSWSNLAFIKINASNLPVISFGDSDNYKPGEKVIAIGNDMPEYQNKFNVGVLNSFNPTYNISGQSLSISEKLEGVFLSDFNSEKLSVGSPIINYSGQLIGVIGSTIQNSQNNFFEIPSNKIKKVLDKVINKKLNTNPILGVYYMPLSKSYALANNLNVDHGDIVYAPSGQQGLAIISGTPASKSKLKLNDIIEKVDDKEVNLGNSLSDILYTYKKGDKINLTVLRNNQEIKISVQL